MLKNPFDPIETPKEQGDSVVSLEKNESFSEAKTEAPTSSLEDRLDENNSQSFDFSESEKNDSQEVEFIPFEAGQNFDPNYNHTPITKKAKLDSRDTRELSDEEYHERVKELNENADNKHYVLFFGTPASGKTWIIGSILHYMKNYLNGVVYLETDKTTENEEELFYLLQDRFNSVVGAKKYRAHPQQVILSFISLLRRMIKVNRPLKWYSWMQRASILKKHSTVAIRTNPVICQII